MEMKRLFIIFIVLLWVISPIIQARERNSEQTLFLPWDHWAYEYMGFLAGKGLLTNYPSDYIREEKKILTRYELALYLKNLITDLKEKPEIVLTLEQEQVLMELLKEFNEELTALGINITLLNRLSPFEDDKFFILKEGYMDLDLWLGQKSETSLIDDYSQDLLEITLPITLPHSKLLPVVPHQSPQSEIGPRSDPPQIIIEKDSLEAEPYYYFGEYSLGATYQDYFLFIPASFLKKPLDEEKNWEIVYNNQRQRRDSYLIVQGGLPLKGETEIEGCYLFPLDLQLAENGQKELEVKQQSALTLLTRLNESYSVKNIRQVDGRLPLDSFARLDQKTLEGLEYINQFRTGLQIGDIILSSGLGQGKTDSGQVSIQQWGLKMEEGPSLLEMTATYLHNEYEKLEEEELKELKEFNLDLQGIIPLTAATSIYGGLSWGYDQGDDYIRRLSLVNSLTSAGVSLRINDYFSLLADFAWYSDLTSGEKQSSTSFGLKWGENNLLVLGYQLLSIESESPEAPVLTGRLSLRF